MVGTGRVAICWANATILTFYDFFIIKGIKDFPNSKLSIFNRWGARIYQMKAYQNNWDGRADNSMTVGTKIVPEGTYYYIIDLGNGAKIIKGFVYINY